MSRVEDDVRPRLVYPDLVIVWYPRDWGQTTATELTKLLATLSSDTTGITFCGNVEVGDEMIKALGPVLRRLRHLGLAGVPIGPRGMHALANDPRASGLEVLLLGGVMVREIGGPSPIPPDKLDPKYTAMATCRLEDEGVSALGHATQLAALRKLDLSNVVASKASWLAFAKSPLIAQLECLTLRGTHVEPATMAVLCEHAVSLRALAIETPHADENARVLANSPIMPQIERLCLRWVRNETIEFMLDGAWPSLHALELSPTLDARTIEIIAHRRGVPMLRTLYLEPTSQIATGEQEIWTDWTGIEIGSSPAYIRIDDIVKQYLSHETIKILPSPSWPATWLGL
jgi:hypothetical protein